MLTGALKLPRSRFSKIKNSSGMLGFDKLGQLNLLTASSTLGDGSLLNCLKMDNQLLATERVLWVKVQPGKQKAASIRNKMGYATLFLETLEIIKVNYTHYLEILENTDMTLTADIWCVCFSYLCINNLKFPRCWKSGGTARPSLWWEWLKFHWPPLFSWGPFGIPFLYFSLFLPHSGTSGVPIRKGHCSCQIWVQKRFS